MARNDALGVHTGDVRQRLDVLLEASAQFGEVFLEPHPRLGQQIVAGQVRVLRPDEERPQAFIEDPDGQRAKGARTLGDLRARLSQELARVGNSVWIELSASRGEPAGAAAVSAVTRVASST